jgi:hypothetical protein
MKSGRNSMGLKAKATMTAAVMALACSWQLAGPVFAGEPSDSGAIPVEIVESEGRYTLLRGGRPYAIKGAGISNWDVASLAEQGGNSFRNWRDYDSPDGLLILDEAARHGLTVAMCIPIGRERHGFDYDDAQAVARQFEFARSEVLRYKDHPALLMWIIGNEPDLNYTNPAVFDAVNDISKMIHEVDGQHPTTTALSFSVKPELVSHIRQKMPDLDIISVQKYADVVNLPRYMDEAGIERPYMVTEWGPKGHWEVEKTSWGAPIEANSSEKAAHYLKIYQSVIAARPDRIIGSYAFLWGQKQERTPSWYGMFLADGSATEAVDVMHYVWNGAWPENRSPQIEDLFLDARTADGDVVLAAGGRYEARVLAHDPDGDTLSYRWVVMHESTARQVGGDKERIPDAIPGLIEDADDGSAGVEAPEQAGAYRLYVYVYDGQGHAGHANIPFLVE